MTVQDLREALEDYDDGAEVRLMTQASWPFENTVLGVTDNVALHLADTHDPDEKFEADEDADPDRVYLVEGQQLGYGSKAAWETCR